MLSDRAIRASIERFRIADPPQTGPDPPTLQIMLDASLSMTTGDGSKEDLARELVILLLKLSEQSGANGLACAMRGFDRNRAFAAADADRILHVPFDSTLPLVQTVDPNSPLAPPAAMRVVVSDFLWPDDPGPLLQSLAAGVLRLWLVQLLDDWELNPQAAGPSRLVDIETDETVELLLDETSIAAYSVRLNQLREQLDEACRAVGAVLVTVSSAAGLEKVCEESLVPAGLMAPRKCG